jgi:hypothetical protein
MTYPQLSSKCDVICQIKSSEEKRKEQHKAVRIISIIAPVAGFATFLSGLLLVPVTWWLAIYPDAGHDFDFIGMFLTVVAISSIIFSYYLWPIAVIGLVLSIVTLFLERNKYFRLLPLAFFTVGICFYAMFYALDYICG